MKVHAQVTTGNDHEASGEDCSDMSSTGCAQPRILTVGHSTRSLEAFIALLRHHSARALADVRTVPRSRRNPQFGREVLPAALASAGIAYRHFPALGGLRRPRPDSPNAGWRNESFRGYADYMANDEFRAGLDELLAWTAEAGTTAVMCAEAVPWRCHRSLIGDSLLARGIVAHHVIDLKPPAPHKLTPFAVVDGSRVVYPPPVG